MIIAMCTVTNQTTPRQTIPPATISRTLSIPLVLQAGPAGPVRQCAQPNRRESSILELLCGSRLNAQATAKVPRTAFPGKPLPAHHPRRAPVRRFDRSPSDNGCRRTSGTAWPEIWCKRPAWLGSGPRSHACSPPENMAALSPIGPRQCSVMRAGAGPRPLSQTALFLRLLRIPIEGRAHHAGAAGRPMASRYPNWYDRRRVRIVQ